MSDDVGERAARLESAVLDLTLMADMPETELMSYFGEKENLEHFRSTLQLAKRECAGLKISACRRVAKTSDEQQHLLDMKNRDMIQLQQKNAETLKELSTIKFQIAQLKNSMAFQEAINAQLTIENLRLKGALESRTTDRSLIQEIQQKSEEVNMRIRQQQKSFDEQIEINTEQAQSIQKLNEKLATAFANDSRLIELETENRELLAELDEIRSIHAENETKWRQDVRDMSDIASGLEQEIRSITLSPAHSSMQRKIEQLTAENESLKAELKRKQDEDERTKERVERYQIKIEEIERRATARNQTIQHTITNTTHSKLADLRNSLARAFTGITTKIAESESKLNKVTGKVERICDLHTAEAMSSNKTLRSALEFALRAMAKLGGTTVLAAPSVDEVLASRESLNRYFTCLKREMDERKEYESRPAIVTAAATPQPRKTSCLSATIDTMSHLMKVMNRQMEEEHSQLMSTLSDRSFSGISGQNRSRLD